ncbi:hypothetical protein QJS66_03880 [Kocuria rhizophila]|nr:hypothetical protein QJS66_03880 [Kocuria rhizophila]
MKKGLRTAPSPWPRCRAVATTLRGREPPQGHRSCRSPPPDRQGRSAATTDRRHRPPAARGLGQHQRRALVEYLDR